MPLCEHENPDECPNHGRKEVASKEVDSTIIHHVGETGIVIHEASSGNLFIHDAGYGAARVEKADRLDLVKTLLEIGRGDNPFPISNAMVETACKAGYMDAKRQQPWLFMSDRWEDVPEDEKDLFRSNFRVALEAALNHREAS